MGSRAPAMAAAAQVNAAASLHRRIVLFVPGKHDWLRLQLLEYFFIIAICHCSSLLLSNTDLELFFHEFDSIIPCDAVRLGNRLAFDTAPPDPESRPLKGHACLETNDPDFRIILDARDVNIFMDAKRDVPVLVELAWGKLAGPGIKQPSKHASCLLLPQRKHTSDRKSWTQSPRWDSLLGHGLDGFDTSNCFEQFCPFLEDVLVLARPDVERELLYPNRLHLAHLDSSVMHGFSLPTTKAYSFRVSKLPLFVLTVIFVPVISSSLPTAPIYFPATR